MLFGVACLQGLLGMQTVTLKLRPLIVTAHLLKLNREQGERPQLPMQTFKFSITYLILLLAALILDHFLLIAI